MSSSIEVFSDVICSIGIVFVFITMVIVLSYEINIEVDTNHYTNRQIIKNIVVGVLGGLLFILCTFLSVNMIIPYFIGIDIFIGLVAYLSGKIQSANIALIINLIFSVMLIKVSFDLAIFHIVNTMVQMLILNMVKFLKIRLSYKRNLSVALITFEHILLVYFISENINLCIKFMVINFISGYIIAWVTDNLNRLVKMYNAYRKQALTDALTGLANVRAYNSIISHIGKNKEKDWAIIYLDIDNFKKINQEYGHSTGDIIIRGVGKVIKNIVPYDDYCFRVGGDEFLILHNQSNTVSAKQLAQEIKDNISIQGFMSTSTKEIINITLSIGINTGKMKTCSFCELVEKADMAMFEAKKQGKNTISVAPQNNLRLWIITKNIDEI